MSGIWMPGFMQFFAGVYLFAGLALFGTFKTPALYMAALAFTAYGVHWFAIGWNRLHQADPRVNVGMAFAFTLISILGIIVFFSAGDHPVGGVFIGLTCVYVADFFASLGSALARDQRAGPSAPSASSGSAPPSGSCTCVAAPVGFSSVRLAFDLDTAATPGQVRTLIRLTERYCVIYQTLAHPPELTIRPSAAASAARVAPPIAMTPSPGSARSRSISSARPPEASRALPCTADSVVEYATFGRGFQIAARSSSESSSAGPGRRSPSTASSRTAVVPAPGRRPAASRQWRSASAPRREPPSRTCRRTADVAVERDAHRMVTLRIPDPPWYPGSEVRSRRAAELMPTETKSG